ncbi:MAG TPA: DUF3039 domain-containing protein [Mycobacteriales bacterium]|jgi:hypothetical protein|nr:DUF3039 domain-containing protein [Mycobacteriales bacterium]
MTETRTIERTETETRTGSGQGKVAHIADKSKITESYIAGTPLVALCGYTWVPSQSPKGLPVCPACKELADLVWGADAERIGF